MESTDIYNLLRVNPSIMKDNPSLVIQVLQENPSLYEDQDLMNSLLRGDPNLEAQLKNELCQANDNMYENREEREGNEWVQSLLSAESLSNTVEMRGNMMMKNE